MEGGGSGGEGGVNMKLVNMNLHLLVWHAEGRIPSNPLPSKNSDFCEFFGYY